ncbi:MAG: translesion DNA synthesis-associated protein ImuA [Ectothiorhodospiraceae bacterium]|nr:translesion DNA synthesis-associated protein ImuA [Ectothiorhodospiraceae bacterium]MCH8503112.1 translesion DNA synthesis-associated protein ImuA [Ectothiorhodospiraceae bacterium]
MNDALNQLLQEPGIWRAADNQHTGQRHIPSGFAELDGVLPGGGWPDAALTELLHAHSGIGELRLLMPALARLSRSGRWIALVAPPHVPYAPALAAQGVDLSRILLVHSREGRDNLWAVEQALRSGTCAAVLAWPAADITGQQLRRLQLAAEAGQSWGILLRHSACAAQTSPAALRLELVSELETTRLKLIKCRGSLGRQEIMVNLDRPRTRAMPLPVSTLAPSPRALAGQRRNWPRQRPGTRPARPQQEPQPQLPLPLETTGSDTRNRLRLVRQQQ